MKSPLGFAFEFKAADDAARTFTGLASTWKKDLGNDVIHKGAFERTLKNWRSSRKERPIPLLDGHDRFSSLATLGKMVEAKETDDGLEATFEMVPGDPASEAALRRIKGGFVTGLSIGYTPVRFEYEQRQDDATPFNRIRHIHELKLHEVSLVPFPMNEYARLDASSVKALLDAARAGTLSDEEKAELRALLDAPPAPADAPPADTPKGLAPDDPKRVALESALRGLKLRSLATA